MQTKFFRLDVLTPVHIGTGEEVDPMSYLMRQEEGEAVCHILDTNAWAADYPDPAELCAEFSGSNIPQMRSFLAGKIDPESYGVRRIRVSDGAILAEYETKLKDQRTTNQLLLSPQMSGNGRTPILPGSSLKGALRTAVIDWLDREQGLRLKNSDYHKALESVLGTITDNAFKQLKISDIEGWADSTLLVEARELRRKEGKTATPKSKCEVLPGRLQGESTASTLFCKLAIGSLNQPTDQRLTLEKIKKSWDWNELAALVNAYLLPRLAAEFDKFYCQPHFARARPVVEKLRERLTNAAPGQMFLRVGHYSQIEFVTVRDNQPQTRQGKDKTPLPYGTTRTLANGVIPFGWVCLTPCSEAEYRQGVTEREAANHAAAARRVARRQEIIQARVQKQLEEAESLRQQQQVAEAEAQRQAELAALAPVDRQLLLLSQSALNENEVIALFTSLPQLEETDRLRVARAIRDLWQADPKKWNKKECSKKQWEKVQQLKKILGED